MTLRDKFSDEEWNKLLEVPLLAGFVVTAADPGGLIGAFQENAAIANSLKTSADAGGDGTLEYAIAEAYKTSEGRRVARDGVRSVLKGTTDAQLGPHCRPSFCTHAGHRRDNYWCEQRGRRRHVRGSGAADPPARHRCARKPSAMRSRRRYVMALWPTSSFGII